MGSLYFFSCGKHEKEEEEHILVTASMVITSPLQNSVYYLGDTVRIQGSAVGTGVLHGYDIMIRRVSDGAQQYFQHIHDHNDTLAISDWWKNSFSGVELEVEVKVTLDHHGNTQSAKVRFQTQ